MTKAELDLACAVALNTVMRCRGVALQGAAAEYSRLRKVQLRMEARAAGMALTTASNGATGHIGSASAVPAGPRAGVA